VSRRRQDTRFTRAAGQACPASLCARGLPRTRSGRRRGGLLHCTARSTNASTSTPSTSPGTGTGTRHGHTGTRHQAPATGPGKGTRSTLLASPGAANSPSDWTPSRRQTTRAVYRTASPRCVRRTPRGNSATPSSCSISRPRATPRQLKGKQDMTRVTSQWSRPHKKSTLSSWPLPAPGMDTRRVPGGRSAW